MTSYTENLTVPSPSWWHCPGARAKATATNVNRQRLGRPVHHRRAELSPPKQPTYVGRRSPLVQDLWQPAGDLPQLRTVLPDSLRLDEIQQAPFLHDAPIVSAVLAVGSVPQAYSTGEIAVVSPDGAWRIVDRESLGMRNPEIVEQQFKLSPDGRLLALGDEFGS